MSIIVRRCRYKGKLATTRYVTETYINLELDGGRWISMVPPHEVEFIDMLDTEKPLEIVTSNAGVHGATFVTRTSDGHIMVDTTGKGFASNWMIFNDEGTIVRLQEGDPSKTTLRLRNTPEEITRYYRVNSNDGSLFERVYQTAAAARRCVNQGPGQVLKVVSRGSVVLSTEIV